MTLLGRDIAVGLQTRHRKDGPGIESWWERDFPQQPGSALSPTQSFPTVKLPRRSVEYPHSSSAELKNE
jgi:hypothetical protein